MDISIINSKPLLKTKFINRTLDFVLDSSHQFFQDNLSGRISSQISLLADNIELILHKISPDFIRGFSMLMAAFTAAYYVNPVFFYTLFLWFLGFSSFSILMSNRLVKLSDNYAGAESLLSGQLVDCITNNSNVRIFSKKGYEISRMTQFLSVTQKAFQTKEIFIVILNSAQGLMQAKPICSND